jgi:hypothetical protein
LKEQNPFSLRLDFRMPLLFLKNRLVCCFHGERSFQCTELEQSVQSQSDKMDDDDAPFLINAPTRPVAHSQKILGLGSDEAKPSDPAPPRFRHGNNLRRRRIRSRNNDEAKVEDEEKGENTAAEESKEVEASIPSRPSSRFRNPFSPGEGAQPTVQTEGKKPHCLTMPMMHQSNYIRRPPDEKLKEKFNSKYRGVADDVPEVHFIGEVVEGVGFNDTFVSCKW